MTPLNFGHPPKLIMTDNLATKHIRTVRSYVRRLGRMTPRQERSIEEHGAFYIKSHEPNTIFDWPTVFESDNPIVVEIGFGQGDNLIHWAQTYPDMNFLGIDVHTPGIGGCCFKCHELGLKNVRLMSHDAVEVLAQNISDNSLAEVHILFPDPWPKKKHHKRRLIQPAFLTLLAQKLQLGGILHIATDWQEYADHILAVLSDSPTFSRLPDAQQASLRPRVMTRFEKKGLSKGHHITEIWLARS